MKKWFLFFLCLCSFWNLKAIAEESLDKIAAIVNSNVITEAELNDAINKTKKQMIASNVSIPNETTLRKHVLDQIINRKIQLELAKQATIEVSEAEVAKAIESVASGNHLSVDQLYAVVQKQGLSKDEYRKEISEEILIHKVQRQSIGRKVAVSDEEVDEFLNSSAWQTFNNKEYHIEDILIILPDSPTPDQITASKKRAENLVTKLRQGSNFQQTAMTESTGSKALQGGDLGWRKLPEIPSVFSEILVHMKENDIYGPIQAANGFHIIHLAGIRDAPVDNTQKTSSAADRKKIKQLLSDRKYEEALQDWIIRIRGESFINLQPESA